VRGNQVIPVESVLLVGIGQGGAVAMMAEGLRVAVASNAGAGLTSGVVLSPDGTLEVAIESRLVPGSVVEVWGFSTPRLLGSARVPDGFRQGDTLTFLVRADAPLDGGGRIDDGAHTLQLRMHATSGFEVLATGITVGSQATTSASTDGQAPTSISPGGPVPTSVPAGGGPRPLAHLLVFVLLVQAAAVRASLGSSRPLRSAASAH
jgi:hypothetical protein